MSDIIQGSDEWHQQRLGKVTASRVADIVRRTKTGVSATRITYVRNTPTSKPKYTAETVSSRFGRTNTSAALTTIESSINPPKMISGAV